MLRFPSLSIAVLFTLLSRLVTCQSSSPSSPSSFSCNQGSPVTTLSACSYLYSQITYCAGPQVATGAPFISCYCNQKVFDAIYDCDSEQRLCYGTYEFDGDEIEALSVWNSACDDRITFTPTTPIVSSLMSTFSDQYCKTAESACQQGSVDLDRCSASYLGKDGKKYSSCFCDPQHLSEVYTCGFLGNISCHGVPATLTNLVEYTHCENFMSVLGSAASGIQQSGNSVPPTVSASSTSTGSSVSESSSSRTSPEASSAAITSPPLPGSLSGTNSPGPTSTTDSSSDATKVLVLGRGLLMGLWVVVSLIFLYG